LLAASAFPAVLLLATACSSSGSSPASTSTTPVATSGATAAQSTAASQSAARSPQQIMPLLLQCLTDHNIPIWDKGQGNTSVASIGTKQGWYKNGKVLADSALYSNADGLEGFYPMSSDFKPNQTIGTWVDNVVSTGKWPKVCGPFPPGS
jgi:hypothetical protein